MKRFNMERSINVLLWIVILCQRIAINISGYQISVGLIVVYIFIIWWGIKRELFIYKKRLFYFLLVVGSILLTSCISSTYSQSFSPPSLFLLIGFYFLTIFTLKSDGQTTTLEAFQTIIFFISFIGIVQFASQLVGIPFRDWMRLFIPNTNIISGYHYAIPIEYGSRFYKSNGLFLAEPSFYSQLIALSMIIEIYFFKRYPRLLILTPALFLSFSGTGLILLAIGIIPLLFTLKFKKLFIPSLILVIVISLLSATGFLSYITSRISEFQSPSSSGFIRFISPFIIFKQFFNENINHLNFWFGLGPGASEDYLWNTTTQLNPPIKLLTEYGILGSLFFVYLAYIFFSCQPFWLALFLFVNYISLSGGLLTPQITILYFPLLLFWKPSSKSGFATKS